MRVRGIPFQQVLLGAALIAALCWNLAHASEIKGLRVDAGATGTRAELDLDEHTPFKVISLANPDRLVVDLPGASVRQLKLPPASGLVKAVRSGQPVPGTTRIVFDLAAPVVALKPHFEDGNGGTRLVLEWPGDNGPRTADAAMRPAMAAARAPVTPGVMAVAAAPTPTSSTQAEVLSPTPAQPESDPAKAAAASADATSRLIASVATPPAPPPIAAGPVQVQSLPPPMPSSSAKRGQSSGISVVSTPAATIAQAPGTIATGVPTHIATGVPTQIMPSADALAQQRSGDAQAADARAATLKSLQAMRRSGLRPLVVAIDPGHGGQDPGAIGLTGKREKDVTLAIGRELARQINATPGLKAYMTRDTDVFIPLNRRAQLARAAKADIFVSIHADAAENRSANGSSVYVLSTKGASSQRARWLADKENSADLIGGRLPASDNTLASVLLDLTQSGHMKASEDAAGHVLSGLADVGNNHKPHIERANFAVLRTSDMPSMLVETAFISNPDEERRLTDPSYQRTLARAVLGGIDQYFQQQPPPGTMYAARAEAGAGVSSTVAGASR